MIEDRISKNSVFKINSCSIALVGVMLSFRNAFAFVDL